VPPYCPNPRCRAHRLDARALGWNPWRRGARRIARPPGRVLRFTCTWCRRSFSSSLFGPDYRCRIAGLASRVFHALAEGQAERQAARTLRVSHGAVRRRRRYLARQALLIHRELVQQLVRDAIEKVELDGLRTFAMSQYEPLDLTTLVASESHFLLDLEPAPLRRSGRMTPRQRRVRAERERRLGLPPRHARARSAYRLLKRFLRTRAPETPLRVASDKEPEYRSALRVLSRRYRIEHITISSHAWRDAPRHPLFATNHLHRLLRHARADHRRETLAFAKRLQGLMDRAWISLLWRNMTKGISERTLRGARVTPAMRIGLAQHPLRGPELFQHRRFPGIVGLSDDDRPLYDGRLKARPHETIAAA